MTLGAFAFSALWGVACAAIGALVTRAWLKSRGRLERN